MVKLAWLVPGIEVLSRRRGQALQVVSRVRPRALVPAVVALMAVASAGIVLVESRTQPLALECTRARDWCTLSDGRRTVEQFPLSRTLRFEARSFGRRWELVAVTQDESVGLLVGSRTDLEARAAELNAFLRDPSQESWQFAYDPRADLKRVVFQLLPAMNALAILLAVLMAKERVTVFDRAKGVARRRVTLIPSTRRIDGFRAVQVRTMRDDPQPWYMRPGTSQHLDDWRRIVLVDGDGVSWWVTPFQNREYARADLAAVAAELATYLGLPVMPDRE